MWYHCGARLYPHSLAMESVKICHFKTFRAGNFALRTFCCFFSLYIHLKSLFCEDILVEYGFKLKKFKGVSIDLKLNDLDVRGNQWWKYNGTQNHQNLA